MVKSMFIKISRDFRHAGITKVLEGNIEKRNFQDWSMGFKKMSPQKCQSLQGSFKPSESNSINQEINCMCHPAFVFLKSFYVGGKE